MPDRTEWTGQKTCDYCGGTADTMYDSASKEGPWAFMCPKCWEKHGFGTLGPGIGQRYDRDQDGRFFETEGWHELFDVQ